jgi:endonuclease/exonuclease/phosphatase family metal-dependent hydrolase
MRKAILIPAVFIAVLLLAAGDGGNVLRIMTFNIRYNNPSDGIYSWDQRKKMVFDLITAEDPDILGLQEVLADQLAALSHEFPGYSFTGVGRDDGQSKGEYAPILYRKSRFTLMQGSTFWLSETPSLPGSVSWNAACTRIVTWAKLKENGTGNVLFFFNTHFDHISEEARLQSARMLMDSIRSIAADGNVVLTGDFNCTISDNALQTLSGFLTDTRSDAAILSPFPTTFIGFPADTGKREVIDHIFISKNWPRVRKYGVLLNNEQGRFPSDHLPVSAELPFLPK